MSREKHSLGKRKAPRRPFVQRQLIADYDGCKLPQSKDFYWATTQNISPGGVAFISHRKPRARFLIVTFGAGRKVCLIGRVAWTNRRADLPKTPFEFGCEFVTRLA